MVEKLRIYIGGLGSGVQEDDLKSRFTSPQLGTVESVELIRSKGRSFGYLEFVPSSDKGLAKLFSTYNGCMWKGGILKLEKAREHYLTRLQHEWKEEAKLKTKSSFQKVNADENVHTFQKPMTHQNMQLKIFFPKLRKVKPIPLKGSGKHKYSFQRVQIPPLPIHFCDCEEHSGSLLAQRNHTNNHARDDHETDHHETDVCEVNEDELNMMKTVLDKLLEKGNCSDKVPCRNEFTEEVSRDATSVDKHQVEDGEEDEVSNDDEDIVINVASRPSRRADVFEDWGWKTTAVDQDYFPIEPVSFSDPHELRVNKNVNLLADKKRKLPAKHIHADNIMHAERQPAKRVRRGSGDDPVSTSTQPIHTESGSKESSNGVDGVAGLHKSAWRDLVKEKQSSAFQISDILVDDHPEGEMKTGCDVTPSSTGKDDTDDEMDNGTDDGDDQLSKNDKLENGRDEGDDQLSKNDKLENRKNDGDDKLSNNDELEKVLHAQSAKAGTSNAKTARGAAWLQKSSWLQLIKDVNSSSFNLAQVLPETASEKQELLPHNCNTPTNSGHGEKCKDLDKNLKSLAGVDIQKPQVTPDKGVHDTSVNLNVSNSAKKLNLVSQDQEQPDLNQSGEKKDGVPAPMPNFLPNARAMGDIMVSETCPFMRNAASMREWTKTKAALSGTHKKRRKGGKVLTQDQ